MQSAQQPADSGSTGIEAAGVPVQRASNHEAPGTQAARSDSTSLGQQVGPGQQVIVPAQRAAPEQAGEGPGARTTIPTRRRFPPVLTVLGGMLALLLFGGAGIAYLAYDRATAPDRSAPDVVVDNFLRAYLVDRDDSKAALYACGRPRLDEIRAFRSDLEDREARYSIRIHLSWGSLTTEPNGTGRRVTVDLRRTIADGSEQAHDRWQFDVIDENGWRVCGARKIG